MYLLMGSSCFDTKYAVSNFSLSVSTSFCPFSLNLAWYYLTLNHHTQTCLFYQQFHLRFFLGFWVKLKRFCVGFWHFCVVNNGWFSEVFRPCNILVVKPSIFLIYPQIGSTLHLIHVTLPCESVSYCNHSWA